MAELLPTYEYKGDNISAVFEGHVIAAGTEFSKVSCTAEEYLDKLRGERGRVTKEQERKSATHVTTPNGLRGSIISRVEGLWGEEITVRFDNNEIRRYATAAADDDSWQYETETPEAPADYREYFTSKLNESYEPTRGGLNARLEDLGQVRTGAANLASHSASLAESRVLDQYVLAAQNESAEIKEALTHLDAVDAENASPAPPVYAAVEQADIGRGKGNDWLDVVAHEMIAESEAQDFDKLLEEGPTLLVSNLDDAAIHDVGIVREAAVNEIVARTAGFQGEEVNKYREAFVTQAELARRNELTYRQENAAKVATVKEAGVADASDEALFL